MDRATEKDWPKRLLIASYKRLKKKDSDRARIPYVEAVCVPEHLALPGSLQAKQLHHFTLNSHWRRAATSKNNKKSYIYVCRVALVLSDSLKP